MSQPSKQDLERVILEAQQQIQMQAQQALMEKMNTICFRRCVPSPVDVGDRQRRCLQQCVGAFLEGWGVAVRAFSLRLRSRLCGAHFLCSPGFPLLALTNLQQTMRLPVFSPHQHPPTNAERNVCFHRKEADGVVGRWARVGACSWPPWFLGPLLALSFLRRRFSGCARGALGGRCACAFHRSLPSVCVTKAPLFFFNSSYPHPDRLARARGTLRRRTCLQVGGGGEGRG